jgi:hypothetical protein
MDQRLYSDPGARLASRTFMKDHPAPVVIAGGGLAGCLPPSPERCAGRRSRFSCSSRRAVSRRLARTTSLSRRAVARIAPRHSLNLPLLQNRRRVLARGHEEPVRHGFSRLPSVRSCSGTQLPNDGLRALEANAERMRLQAKFGSALRRRRVGCELGPGRCTVADRTPSESLAFGVGP